MKATDTKEEEKVFVVRFTNYGPFSNSTTTSTTSTTVCT